MPLRCLVPKKRHSGASTTAEQRYGAPGGAVAECCQCFARCFGAAGGLCGGLYGVLGGSTQSGFDLLAALADLDSAIAGADLVITGEGRTDRQTLMGKLPYRVAQRAKKLGKRCVVISGDGGNAWWVTR